MRKIKISAGVTGVIATGSFENLRPTYAWEEEITDCELSDEQIETRIKELYQKSFTMLRQAEERATIERIERERQDFRFYISPKSGKMLPSVTSIIGYDSDFFCEPEELRQYASQGNITHALVREFIKTGEWKSSKDITDIWTDIVILTKGNLKLSIEVGDFQGFLKKYPITQMKNSTFVCNDEFGYCGTPDFVGVPEFKEAEKVITICDVKRTADTLKNGMQLAAYCNALKIAQGMIIQINDKTEQGFSKPIVYNKEKLEGYFKMFLDKKKEFSKRYGL